MKGYDDGAVTQHGGEEATRDGLVEAMLTGRSHGSQPRASRTCPETTMLGKVVPIPPVWATN